MSVSTAKTISMQYPASLKEKMMLATLVIIVLISALAVAYQVYLYRASFVQQQKIQSQKDKLDEEWGRLLIEQQTFGAITQVGSSAVLHLQMYSPKSSEVVTLTQKQEKMPSNE